MIGRRSVLRLLGAAPAMVASAPALMAEKAAGLQGGIASALALTDPYGVPMPGQAGNVVTKDGESYNLKVLRHLATHGIPEHKMADFKRRAKIVVCLDSDIAVNRSFSLATKLRIQQERNIKRYCDEFNENFESQLTSEKFVQRFGWNLW